jgi:pathogenesis-related protein 1
MKLILLSFFSAFSLTTFPSFSGEIDANAIIAAHNKWREDVGLAEKLSYSPALAMKAQAWADSLKRHNHCQMQHSKSNGSYGENLFWSSARQFSDGSNEFQKVSPEKVVNSWASEKKDFDYDSNRCKPGKKCGHYTQIVWRSTTTVGCGKAACEDTKEQVYVCQYQPAGNWIGRKPY